MAGGSRPAKISARMAAGKPVVFSGSGEGAKMVRQAKGGIVVPPQHPKALASPMRDFVTDRYGAEEMGRNGRYCVEHPFGSAALVEDWIEELSAADH